MSAAGTAPAGTASAGSPSAAATRPATLVRGSDPTLVAQAAHDLIQQLVGDGDASLMVEEFGGPGVEPFEVGVVIDACTTPPFLVERRVVVVRDAGQLSSADAKRLVGYLEDPLPTTALVVVAGGGAVPQALAKTIGSVGAVIDTSVGIGRSRSQWLAGHLKDGPVRLDGAATALLSEHLGEDMGRLQGLMATLASAYGDRATVTADDLEPYLGAAGSLAPWDLTDAIDAGDTTKAISVLHRMLQRPDSHPLVVMSVLQKHYRQMLRLDGAGVNSPEEAAELLELRSSYPAKKALAQARRLGGTRIARAIRLLAEADLDLRGLSALDGPTVLEVLVARLSRPPGSRR